MTEAAVDAPSRLRRLAPILLLTGASIYVGLELAMAGRVGPSLDDGWIYMAFSRAFLEGDGFSYPGHDGPVAAVTGPIWSFALVLAMAVFGPVPWAVKLAGFAAGAFAVFGASRLARAATGDATTAALVAVLIAATPRVLWGALSGMEVALACGLTSFGLALHLERRHDTSLRWLLAIATLTLAGWARPEVFAFVPIVVLHRFRWDGVLLALPLLLIYPLANLAIYGHPLPTTFYAKAGADTPLAIFRFDGLVPALAAFGRNVGLQLASFAAWLPSFLPFLAPAVLLGVRRGWRDRNGVPFLATAIVLFAIARGAIGFQPPWFQQGRYFVQLWPLFLIVGLYGMDVTRVSLRFGLVVLVPIALGFAVEPELAVVLAFDWIPGQLDASTVVAERSLIWAPAAVFTALAIAGLLIGRRGDGRIARPPAWLLGVWIATALGFGAVRHGEGVRDTYELNVRMAEIVAEAVPEGELVACHDIGALGFFARRPLLDLAGLGSPEVALSPRLPGARPDIVGIIRARKPRYVCMTPDMADMINPAGSPLAGVRTVRLIATVESDHNVTVQGSVYHLIELVWE